MKISYNIIIIVIILILLFEIIKCSKPYKKHIEKFYINDDEQLGHDDMPIIHGSEISLNLKYLPCIKELDTSSIGSSNGNCIGTYKSKYDVSNVVASCGSESKHIIRDYSDCRSINYEIGSHSGIGSQSRNETTFITLPDTKLTHYKSFTYNASRYSSGVHNENIEEEPLYEITPTMINNRYGSNTIEKNNAGSSCNLEIDSSCNYNNGEYSEYSLKCLEKYYNEQSKTFSSDPHEQLIVLNTILKIFLEAESKECLIGNGEDKEFIGVLKEDTGVGIKFFAIIIDDDSEIKIEQDDTDFIDFVLYRKETIQERTRWESCQYDYSKKESIRNKIKKIGKYNSTNKDSNANIIVKLTASEKCAQWGSCYYDDFDGVSVHVQKWKEVSTNNGSCGSGLEILDNCPNNTNTLYKIDECDNSHLDYNLAYSIICDSSNDFSNTDFVEFTIIDVSNYYQNSIKNYILKIKNTNNCYMLDGLQILNTLFPNKNLKISPNKSSNLSVDTNSYPAIIDLSSTTITPGSDHIFFNGQDTLVEYVSVNGNTITPNTITPNTITPNTEQEYNITETLQNSNKDAANARFGTERNKLLNGEDVLSNNKKTNINNYIIGNILRKGYRNNNFINTETFIFNTTTSKIVNMYRIWGDFNDITNNPKNWIFYGFNNGTNSWTILDEQKNFTSWSSYTNKYTEGNIQTNNRNSFTEFSDVNNTFTSISLKDANTKQNDIEYHNYSKTFTINNDKKAYQYYKLEITATQSNKLHIMEFKMYNRLSFNNETPLLFNTQEINRLRNNIKTIDLANFNNKYKNSDNDYYTYDDALTPQTSYQLYNDVSSNNIYKDIEIKIKWLPPPPPPMRSQSIGGIIGGAVSRNWRKF